MFLQALLPLLLLNMGITRYQEDIEHDGVQLMIVASFSISQDSTKTVSLWVKANVRKQKQKSSTQILIIRQILYFEYQDNIFGSHM